MTDLVKEKNVLIVYVKSKYWHKICFYLRLAESERLFENPLHPYTRALLSAIPQPDPISEKNKVIEVYEPNCHNYKANPPKWIEIEPNHYILANEEELVKYKKMTGGKK